MTVSVGVFPRFTTACGEPSASEGQRVQRPYFPRLGLTTMACVAPDHRHANIGGMDDVDTDIPQSALGPWTDKPTGETSCGAADEGEVVALVERWRRVAEHRHPSSWPHGEAHDVVVAVLGVKRNGPEATLHEAGQRWGSVRRDTETLADRVEMLRQIMVDAWPAEPDSVHRALDAVVASAAIALSRRFEVDSRTDALTGAGNRRAFDDALGAAITSACRQHYSLSLVMVDIDGMKDINDSEGHQAGDDALVKFTHAIAASLRQEDHVYRAGGDEFAIIMPYCAANHPAASMERIQMQGAPAFSWGVSSFPEDGVVASSLIAAADAAMYRRKPWLRRRSSGSAVPTGVALRTHPDDRSGVHAVQRQETASRDFEDTVLTHALVDAAYPSQ